MKEHIYQNIEGWFTFPNLYRNAVNTFNDGSHFVEVGAWLGRSATFMAVEIINSGKKIKFDCVDTWLGSAEHTSFKDVQNKTLYDSFLQNIEPVKENINPIKKPSLEAVNLYANDSLDFVFIDASHDYKNVMNDIKAWFPKVKKGGFIGGHDYTCENPVYYWPEVSMAVNDFLKEINYNLNVNSEGCWGIYKK